MPFKLVCRYRLANCIKVSFKYNPVYQKAGNQELKETKQANQLESKENVLLV